VQLAKDLKMERLVALKSLRNGVGPEIHQRFLREAQATSKLHHPHVVKVYDSGLDAEGHPFIVYEYIEGCDLGVHVARSGPPSPALARTWGKQIAEALAATHEMGLVHRDVKPGNILVRPDGALVLCDFGLVIPEVGERLTAEGFLLGTPAFMAPELWEGATATPASDQFAWAASLVVVLTGESIYGTGEFQGILDRLAQRTPLELPSTLCSSYSPLTRVLKPALARAPKERYATSQEFVQAFQVPPQVDTRLLPDPSPVVVMEEKSVPTASIRSPATPQRRKHFFPVWGLAVFLLGGILLICLPRSKVEPSPVLCSTPALDPKVTPLSGPSFSMEEEAQRLNQYQESLRRLRQHFAPFSNLAIPEEYEGKLELARRFADPAWISLWESYLDALFRWCQAVQGRGLLAPDSKGNISQVREWTAFSSITEDFLSQFYHLRSRLQSPSKIDVLNKDHRDFLKQLQQEEGEAHKRIHPFVKRLLQLPPPISLEILVTSVNLATRANSPALARAFRTLAEALLKYPRHPLRERASWLLANNLYRSNRHWPLPCGTRAQIHRNLSEILLPQRVNHPIESQAILIGSFVQGTFDCQDEGFPDQEPLLAKIVPLLTQNLGLPSVQRNRGKIDGKRVVDILRGAAQKLEAGAGKKNISPELLQWIPRLRQLAAQVQRLKLSLKALPRPGRKLR
jgi:hypothetical protein